MISESIWSNGNIVIPMADVQHLELTTNKLGWWIITKHTKWSLDADIWENPIYLSNKEIGSFKQAWFRYRAELDGVGGQPACEEEE